MSSLEGTGMSPESAGSHGISPSGPAPDQPVAQQRKSGKRDRVALACQRCKTRKQKCDGQRPACASCARLSLKCVYIVPLVPAAGEKKLYIKALEQRVAELEAYIASSGHQGVSNNHFRLTSQPGTATSSSQQNSIPVPPGQPSLQIQQPDDDANDILIAVRDLSLSASGHYVGASSNITIGRVLNSVVNSERSSAPATNDEHLQEQSDPAPKSVYSTSSGEMIGVPILTHSVATRLLQGWFRHIYSRYPILHSARVMEMHNNRDNLADEYDKTILHIVYAISGRWLESAGETGHFFSDYHYDLAFDEMDLILGFRDSRTIDYLLLMALYCTRAPRDPGAWTYVGAAMRLCVELGLHRRPRRPNLTMMGEMNKRRFWTTYFLDRDISFAIGRPPSISDHDIDVDLPFDIPEETINDEVVRRASTQVSDIPVSPPNSLTSFIHRTRLKKIESEIQHIVYRVDQPGRIPDTIVDAFLDRLNIWKDTIPYEARNYVHRQDVAFEGIEFYTIHYHRCVRYLLYPKLAEQPINMRYVKLCADACAGVLTDYRRLHQVFPVGFSALSIQSVFLAGLNMIYCAWLAPMNSIDAEAPLTDCQLLLYIMTERYPSARKYRDVFERIKSAILSVIAQGKHGPRNPVNLEPNVQAGFQSLQAQISPSMGAEYSFMVNTMTGNSLAGNAAAPPFELGLDPSAANPLVGGYANQQPVDVGQYQVWPGVTHDMGQHITGHNLTGMGNMYHQ